MPWGPIVPFEASLCGWPKADCRPSFVVFGLKLARWAAATFCRLPSWCACPRWRPKLLRLASRPCSSDRKTGQPASARRFTVFSSACDALLARWARRDALPLAKLVCSSKTASQATSARKSALLVRPSDEPAGLGSLSHCVLGVRRALGPLGSPRCSVARQAGVLLQDGVSCSFCLSPWSSWGRILPWCAPASH